MGISISLSRTEGRQTFAIARRALPLLDLYIFTPDNRYGFPERRRPLSPHLDSAELTRELTFPVVDGASR